MPDSRDYAGVLSAAQWLHLLANAALGLRHPATDAHSRAVCISALERALETLCEAGAIKADEYGRICAALNWEKQRPADG